MPEHFDYTTIGATEDFVVPATNISLPGATETVAAVDDLNQHSAIVHARRRAQGRAAPRSRVDHRRASGPHRAAHRGEPVLISRFEHMAGDDAEFVLRGGLQAHRERAPGPRRGGRGASRPRPRGSSPAPALRRLADARRPRSNRRAAMKDGPSDLAADADGVVVTTDAAVGVRARCRTVTSSWRVPARGARARAARARFPTSCSCGGMGLGHRAGRSDGSAAVAPVR